MSPGDLIKVDRIEDDSGVVVLLKKPDTFRSDGSNPVVARLRRKEVGILLALVEVEVDAVDGWRVGGKHLEACVLFGDRFGWNAATWFSVL